MPKLSHTEVTISNGGTVSNGIQLGVGRTVLALVTPAALTGTALSFQASVDGSTYNTVTDEGSAYSVTAAASRFISIKPALLAGARFVKVVSGSAEGADRTIIVVSGEVD